jgi:hypothetical protein
MREAIVRELSYLKNSPRTRGCYGNQVVHETTPPADTPRAQ